MWVFALVLTAAGSGAAWAKLAAWRAGERTAAFVLHALLGGAAAFGLAIAAYEAATWAGVDIRWAPDCAWRYQPALPSLPRWGSSRRERS